MGKWILISWDFLLKILVTCSIIASICGWINPLDFWPAGIFALSIPLFIILQLFFGIYALLFKRKAGVYLFISLFFCLPYFPRTFALSLPYKTDNNSNVIDILSYNVQVFNAYNNSDEEHHIAKSMIQYIKSDPADIKCFQEFYYSKKSSIFNSIDKIKNEGYTYYVKSTSKDALGARFGTAIFSKFPIIRKGEVEFDDPSDNNAIFIDVKINSDTLRIYSVHLESMNLESKGVFRETVSWEKRLWNLSMGLRNGLEKRALQTQILLEHSKNSPIKKQIICGDFNETPYGYVYSAFSSEFLNAFENKGNGIGFTLNTLLPFLRIDHQFYSPEIQCISFQTHSEVTYSDHYPIRAKYKIP